MDQRYTTAQKIVFRWILVIQSIKKPFWLWKIHTCGMF